MYRDFMKFLNHFYWHYVYFFNGFPMDNIFIFRSIVYFLMHMMEMFYVFLF